MGQKDGVLEERRSQKWIAAVDLQPTFPKSDRLLGAAWLSKRLTKQLSQSSPLQSTVTWLERGAGAVFVYFGIKLALADNRA